MSNETSNPGSATTATPKNTSKRRWMLRGLAAVCVIAAIAVTAWYFMVGRWYEKTEDAYIDGNVVQITPLVAGTVISIGADDNDLAQAGQTLIEFDPSDARVALSQAEANLARAVRQVRGLFSNVSSLEADLNAKQVSLDKARADYQRRKNLAASGAISSEELAHAREALAAAESAMAGSKQQLETSKALVDDTAIASHPEVLSASAALRQAYLATVRTTLVAPVTGYVAKRSAQVGQRVQAGTPLMAVVPLGQAWVAANFKETQLQHMRLGQKVKLRSDLYGSDVEYNGRISGLGVGTGSAFSLLPAQNATGNWIKIVQRVPVRITIDPKELQQHPLRVGLSMDAEVDLHDQSGQVLSQQARTEPVFSTDIYKQQLSEGDALVDRIIRENMAQVAGGDASGGNSRQHSKR